MQSLQSSDAHDGQPDVTRNPSDFDGLGVEVLDPWSAQPA